MSALLRLVHVTVLALLASVGSPARGEPAVVVELAEEKLSYRTYPKGKPPRDIDHGENQTVAGYCDTEFEHRCRVAFTYRSDGGPATITQVRIDSALTVTIWTEEGSGPGVMHHEEAHRAIAKHYYALTRPVGRRLAEALVGTTVPLHEAGGRRDTSPIDAIQQRLLDDLSRETTARNRVAQVKFDTYTYGQPDDVINQALHRALAEEAAEHAAAPPAGGRIRHPAPAGTDAP